MRAAGSAFLPGRRDQVKGRLAAAWSRALPFYLFFAVQHRLAVKPDKLSPCS